MQPLKFPAARANTGLAIGAGLASGFQNYMKARAQRQQMQSQQAQMQAMAQYRQAQAQALLQKNASVNTQKVHAAYLMDQNGITDGMAQSQIKEIMKKGTPQDIAAVTNWAQQQAAAGQPYRQDLNPNEAAAYRNEVGANSKLGAAQIAGTTRIGAAQIYGDSRGYVADQSLAGKQYAADHQKPAASGSGYSPADKAQIQSLQTQMAQTHSKLLDVDGTSTNGMPKYDETTKAVLKNQYTQEMSDLSSKLQKFQPASGAQAAPSQPMGMPQSGAPAGPAYPNAPQAGPAAQGAVPGGMKTLQSNQWSQANPGDFVAAPNGQGFLKAVAKDNNGVHFEFGPDGKTPKVYAQPMPTAPVAQAPAAPIPVAIPQAQTPTDAGPAPAPNPMPSGGGDQ